MSKLQPYNSPLTFADVFTSAPKCAMCGKYLTGSNIEESGMKPVLECFTFLPRVDRFIGNTLYIFCSSIYSSPSPCRTMFETCMVSANGYEITDPDLIKALINDLGY